MWRPILSKISTLEEVQTHYSLCDLVDAHEALDIMEELSQNNKEGK